MEGLKKRYISTCSLALYHKRKIIRSGKKDHEPFYFKELCQIISELLRGINSQEVLSCKRIKTLEQEIFWITENTEI